MVIFSASSTQLPAINRGYDMNKRKIKAYFTRSACAIAILICGTIASGASDSKSFLQNIKMVPQIGHSQAVQDIFFARTRPLFITAAKDGKIKIWSTDHRLIRTIEIGDFRSMALHPDDSMIVICKLGGVTELWSLEGKRIRRLPGMKKPILEQIAFSPVGDYLAVCSASTKSDYCQLFGLDGSLRGRIDHPLNGKLKSNVSGIGFSPDGRKIYLAIGQEVYVYSNAGSALGKFRVTEGFNAALAVSPDGQLIATADSQTSRNGSIPHTRLWTKNGKLIAEYTGHASHSLAFSSDGQWLVSGGWKNNQVLVLDRKGRKIHSFPVGRHSNESPARIAVSPDRDRIVTADKNFNPVRIKSWTPAGLFAGEVRPTNSRVMAMDVHPQSGLIAASYLDHWIRYWALDGRLLRSHPANYDYPDLLAIAPNGRAFVSGGTELTIWNDRGKALAKIPVHKKAGRAVQFTPDSRYLLTGGIDGYVNVIAINNTKQSKRFRAHEGKDVTAIAVHPDGKRFATGSIWERFRIWNVNGKQLADFRLPQGTKGPFSNLNFMHFIPDGRELVVYTTRRNEEIRFYDMNGKFRRKIALPVRNTYQNGAMTISPDGRWLAAGVNRQIGLWDLKTLKLKKALNGHASWIDEMEFTEDSSFLVSAGSDGILRVWNVADATSYAMFSEGDEWIIYSDDGYFDASRYGGDLVSMVSGFHSYSVDQFSVFMNRPDVLYERLGIGSKQAINHFRGYFDRRLAAHGVSAGQLRESAPTVKILSKHRKGKMVELTLQTDARSKKNAMLQVYVNDVPGYSGLGRAIKGGRQKLTEKVELAAGNNKIEVSITNRAGIESLRVPLYVNYKQPVKGDLYYVGLGVSAYRDKSLNLQYADKDIEDMSAFLGAYKGYYVDVHRLELTNTEATRKALEKIERFLAPAKVDDTVIFLVAGHGGYEYGKLATYYFLSHEANPDRLGKTAIPFDNLEAVLSGIKPRRKLLLLDTCQSGEFDAETLKKIQKVASKRGLSARSRQRLISKVIKEPRTYLYERDRYIYNNLTRRTGATVFSSSLANESSLENSALKNGVFTRAVIETWANPAADTDKDGFISVMELETGVKALVAGMTGDLQHPAIERENIYQDIRLPVIRKKRSVLSYSKN